MDYLITYRTEPNLLLEALAYFGRRAAGSTPRTISERLANRSVDIPAAFQTQLQSLDSLMDRLDAQIAISQEELAALFGNLKGFPFNTVGSFCPAFLLFYPMVSEFDGCFDRTMASFRKLDRDEISYRFAACLDLADDLPEGQRMSEEAFAESVRSLSVPSESKTAIRNLLHNAQQAAEQAAPWIARAIELLQTEDLLAAMGDAFGCQVEESGAEAFLSTTSGLTGKGNASFELQSFVFGFDTNLSAVFSHADEQEIVYCGVLRRDLIALVNRPRDPGTDVYEAIKLLADRTRFDILCYLRDHVAYGQELSERFGLSRNTIHHHMGKLLSAHLVTCTVDGNRVYYAVNRERMSALLDRQREMLITSEE